jgi:RNA polymerase sigma-70 factor, ECF subfamily
MFETVKDKWLVKQFLFYRSETAFNKLYKAHHASLYRIAVQLADPDRMLAEDLVQSTWVRAIEGLDKFKWKCELRTWLVSILINCSREQNRKKQLYGFMEESILEISAAENFSSMGLDINKALTRLPAGYRMVLILHDIEGYKHTEIGELLSISEGTSKSQLFNARNYLKKLLQ